MCKNVGTTVAVGANLRVRPNMHVCPNKNDDRLNQNNDHVNPIMAEHTGSPIHHVMQLFANRLMVNIIQNVFVLHV